MNLAQKEGPRLGTKNFMKTVSSAIDSIDYDAKSKILEIEFKKDDQSQDGIYHYIKVPKTQWNSILKQIQTKESLGKYINQEIKPKYDYYELIVSKEL